MNKVRVLYHDNCFDGVSSAAVFSRFYEEHVDSAAEIEYEGLTRRHEEHEERRLNCSSLWAS